MGKTFAEKIFSKKVGRDVSAGEIVIVTPDVCLSHDNTAAIIRTFLEIGVEKIFDPALHVIVLDHCSPPANEEYAKNHKEVREFVEKHNIKRFHDINTGICHQIMVEKGYVLPGMIAVGSDSHSTTYGAVGALGVGIGRSEMAAIFATGKIWFRVPESMKIKIEGKFTHPYITSKDLSLKIIGDIGTDGGLYRSIEFCGSSQRFFSISDRMVLCNMVAEMGAKNGVFPPDERTINYIKSRTEKDFEAIFPDENARYECEYSYNLGEITPLVACPHDVNNIKSAGELKGVKFHQALLGTCTNGRIEDIKISAKIIKGKKVHKNVRFLVLPASMEIYLEALKRGYLRILADAGGVILNPNCGPCLGAHEGILAPSEVCLSTMNRNFRGRMGCRDAEIYLASPATVTASAIAGEIIDPRELE